MNLTLEEALLAMDALVTAGYTVTLMAIPQTKWVVPGHDGPLYRIECPTLHFEDVDIRNLCDLAESVGLTCRYQLNAFRFERLV